MWLPFILKNSIKGGDSITFDQKDETKRIKEEVQNEVV